MNCTKKTKINLIEKINMMIHVLNLTKRDEKFIYIYIYIYVCIMKEYFYFILCKRVHGERKLKSKFWFWFWCFERERDLFCVRPKAVQTQSEPNNPAKMLDANPILAQTKRSSRSAAGLRFQELTPAGRVVSFLLQNLSHPNPTCNTPYFYY